MQYEEQRTKVEDEWKDEGRKIFSLNGLGDVNGEGTLEHWSI